MKKFRCLDLDKGELELYGEFEEYGILQREDDELYELCDADDEKSFKTVRVIFEDGKIFVDFNEPSAWSDDSIIVGEFLD